MKSMLLKWFRPALLLALWFRLPSYSQQLLPVNNEPLTVETLMELYQKDRHGTEQQFKGRPVAVRDLVEAVKGRTIILRNRGIDKDSVKCETEGATSNSDIRAGILVDAIGILKGRNFVGDVTLAQCVARAPASIDPPATTSNTPPSPAVQELGKSEATNEPEPSGARQISDSDTSPPKDTVAESAPTIMSAQDLIREFERDSSVAERQYKGKAVTIRDLVQSAKGSELHISALSRGDYLKCSAKNWDDWRSKGIREGTRAEVIGIVRGRGMMGNITLDNCRIISAVSPEDGESRAKTAPATLMEWMILAGLVSPFLLLGGAIWYFFIRIKCPKCKNSNYIVEDTQRTSRTIDKIRMSLRDPGQVHARARDVIVNKVTYRETCFCKICDTRWQHTYVRTEK